MDPLTSLFNKMPLPLIVLGENWQVISVNKAFEEIFQTTEGALRGRLASELFGEITAAKAESPWSVSTFGLNSDLSLPVAFRMQELGGNNYLLTILTESDGLALSEGFATQLSSSILNSEEAKAIFSSQKQLSLLGHLAGGVAHDLNNILTGVLGHLSLLKASSGSSVFQSSLASAEDGAKKACATAQQILEFARGRETATKAVELAEVVKKVSQLLRVSLPKDINLEIATENIHVLGDESELSQLLMNLVINSRDAMPKGGRIDIRLERVKEEDVGIECASLTVHDNGSGIPPELRDRIFEPFFTTKDPGKGTGLGLSNVARTVHRLGGAIAFDSQPGVGTVFEIRLPIFEGEVPESTERSSEIQRATAGERILVVEDEETVRIVMQRSLEHLGYQVVVAEHGKQAEAIFVKEPFGFDLVVVDVMMPEMPGDELFDRLREINPKIPVLVASGYASDVRTGRILQAGRSGYIQKPFGVEDLAAEVRRCIEEFRA